MDIYTENALVMAPLAGFTDLPYRNSLRRNGCYYCFAEMVDADSLVYGNHKSFKMLERGKDEPWLGAQLLGCKPDMIAKATEIINEYHFDVVDFNLGCPAPKVVKKHQGAELARDPEAAARALEAITANSNVPVTAKTRISSEDRVEDTIALCKKLETAGAQVITIHGRIREKFYSGDVFFDHISAVREVVSVPVFANGGIMGRVSYDEIRQKTGCDSVYIARGAMGNPWIFNEISCPDSFAYPTPEELADEVNLHLSEMIEFYGEKRAMIIGRKIVLDYMRGRGFGGEMKSRVSRMQSAEDLKEFVAVLRGGPADSYWTWLSTDKDNERRMSNPASFITNAS